ncbi:hypothetical protein ACQBAT_01245 [Ornithinimicrobium sp. Y1847]|uniref:hypothetical protein n=1 Tax=Ornithinimicrobium sp. Y1847 TaxID=3405419 RepID=UPI003B66C231
MATVCNPEDDYPIESQTSFAWEATWIGPEPGVGKQLVLEYEDADGNVGTVEIDTTLVLCAVQEECEEDLDALDS